MDDFLYRITAVLLISLLLIIWYFWDIPDLWRRFNKDFRDALDPPNGGPPAST